MNCCTLYALPLPALQRLYTKRAIHANRETQKVIRNKTLCIDRLSDQSSQSLILLQQFLYIANPELLSALCIDKLL
jgi:hypothetical protein